LSRYSSQNPAENEAAPALEDAKCFDLEFMIVEDCAEPQRLPFTIHLRQVAGRRRMAITIGYCEGWALDTALRKQTFPRPLTYELMAGTIQELGAHLQHVLIDRLSIPDQYYGAKLCIFQSGQIVQVDARPSDVFVLAVTCECPIFITNEVLGKLVRCHE
jgi:bifunctional DNase/RNase